MQHIPVHEAADLFPLDEDHIDDLAEDIKTNGQQVPIELFEGKIIDGRRRFAACQRIGKEPLTRTVKVADPIAYVLSLNLHRRHLTPSQLSMVAARVRAIYDKQAKERQTATLKKGDKPVPASLPERERSDARDLAGKAVGVSGKSVDYATRVIERGVPELVKAVDEGRIAVSTAAIHASDPPEVQKEIAGAAKIRYDRSAVREHLRKEPEPTPEPMGNGEVKVKGVGIVHANEAINSLTRIPKNDALRQRGLQLVMDWIRHNK